MRRRLLLSYLGLTLLVLLVLEVPLAIAYRDRARDQLTAGLERDAFVLAAFGEDAIQGNGGVDLQQLAAELPEPHRRTGGDRRRQRAPRSPTPTRSTARPTRSATGPSSRPALGNQVTTGTTSLGLARHRAALRGGADHVGRRRVRRHPHQLLDRAGRGPHPPLLAGAARDRPRLPAWRPALVAEVVFRWVTRPLLALRDAAGRLGSGDLTTRAPTGGGPPEVQELAESFNTMAGRLDELVQAQRAFVADASHQLRTPLTALRLRLENLEQEISDDEAIGDLDGGHAPRPDACRGWSTAC